MPTAFRRKFIGDRAFYRMVIAIALPLVIQQGITSFVTLLDNLMVGALGEQSLSGVSIVNQLIFVYNLAVFGGLSGASIFGAQFFGTGDWNGMRHTFRFRLLFGVITTIAAFGVFLVWGDSLALLFLENENNSSEAVAATLAQARSYLRIAVWGLIPFVFSQIYTGLLRETGETVHPMISSVMAIFVNLVLNYCLIYGAFFFPEMGVAGAALATVIARILEAIYIITYTHTHIRKYPFMEKAYSSLHIPASLCRKIIVTGTPLMLNELLWSLGMTIISSNYAARGLSVVAASNIASTAWNLFSIIMMAMGTVVSIMVGQQLGAGKIDEAKSVDNKLIFVTLVIHIIIGIAAFLTADLIPLLYDIEDSTRALAASMLRIQGIVLPVHAFVHVAYFTIRSGGKTGVTFLFDCCYTWCVPVVLSFVLCRFTALPVITCYAIVQVSDLIKMGIAIPMLASGFWAKNIVGKE